MCFQIHQHKRLTRAQSHHGSEEEKRKRKILARKVHEFERFPIIMIHTEQSHCLMLNIMVVKIHVSEIETVDV